MFFVDRGSTLPAPHIAVVAPLCLTVCYIVASLGVIVVSGKGAASAEMGDRSLPANNAGESKVAPQELKMKKLCPAADCCQPQKEAGSTQM